MAFVQDRTAGAETTNWNETELKRARRACLGGRLAFLLCAALAGITTHRPDLSFGLFGAMALTAAGLVLYPRLRTGPEREDARYDLHRIFQNIFLALWIPVMGCAPFFDHQETGTLSIFFAGLLCIFPFLVLAELGKALRRSLFEDVVSRAVTASLWIFIPAAAIILISLLFIPRASWLALPLLMLMGAMLIFADLMHGTHLRLSGTPEDLRLREEKIQQTSRYPDLNAEDLRMMRKQRLLVYLMFALVLFLLFGFPYARPFFIRHIGNTLTDFLPFILLLGIMIFNAGTTAELECTIFTRDHYERHQKCWLWQMFICTAITYFMTWYAIQLPPDFDIWAISFWLAGIYSQTHAFHNGPDESYDDEVCREMRNRAMLRSWQAFPVPAALIAFTLSSEWRPRIGALWVGMWIITLWATTPVAIYAWLFHRSGQGEEA